jgi:hypothetical protein
VVIGLAIAAVVAFFALAVVHVHFFAFSTGPADSAASCQESVPPGASPAAAAYLKALNTGYIGWTQVSRSLQAENGEVHLDDLKNEAATDASLILTVQTIKFSGPVAATAKQYIQVVNEYVSQLVTAVDHYGYYSSNHEQFTELGNARQALAQQMRQDLDLPAGKCTVLRP